MVAQINLCQYLFMVLAYPERLLRVLTSRAPTTTGAIVERVLRPVPPDSDTLMLWPEVARHAAEYWSRLAARTDLSPAFRLAVERSGAALSAMRARVGGG